MEPFYAVTNPFVLILIGVLSTARVARLVTHDTFPPVEWLRPRLAARLGSWAEVTVCPFCAAPYLAAVNMAWFWLTYRHGDHSILFVWGWLIPNLWWAISYVSAIVVAYDQPE